MEAWEAEGNERQFISEGESPERGFVGFGPPQGHGHGSQHTSKTIGQRYAKNPRDSLDKDTGAVNTDQAEKESNTNRSRCWVTAAKTTKESFWLLLASLPATGLWLVRAVCCGV